MLEELKLITTAHTRTIHSTSHHHDLEAGFYKTKLTFNFPNDGLQGNDPEGEAFRENTWPQKATGS